MIIKQVNEYMVKCRYSEKKKGLEMLKEINTEKYNGVDVKKVEKKEDVIII